MNLEETRQRIKLIRTLAKTKYAWPGGYEIIFALETGDILCADCVLDTSNPTHIEHPSSSRFCCRDGWGISGYYNMSEVDGSEWCCNCGKEIT